MTMTDEERVLQMMLISEAIAETIMEADLPWVETVFLLGGIATHVSAARGGDIGLVTGRYGFACGHTDFVRNVQKLHGGELFELPEETEE